MRTSHKEVCAHFVGTGVLDCPLSQKFDTQKTKINPDRFLRSVGFRLFCSTNWNLSGFA